MWSNKLLQVIWMDLVEKKWLFLGVWIVASAAIVKTVMETKKESTLLVVGNFGAGAYEKLILPSFLILLYIFTGNSLELNRIFACGGRKQVFGELLRRVIFTTLLYVFCYAFIVFAVVAIKYGASSLFFSLLFKVTFTLLSFLFFMGISFVILVLVTKYFIFSMIILVAIPFVDQTIDVYFDRTFIVSKAFWDGESPLFWQDATLNAIYFVGLSILVLVLLEGIIKQKSFY
ncbi:hypothetical protein [Listeria aquatica]|uniref:Uncharacterized protein n=1 Tax=Listeria aquatica FSL S10-1188 TaxID=1265818 RepID=W7BAQ6_9LIST|nr:hypothetical protein [Listeria aquatica]EUJ21765.1 hypothetical protein MAQA_00080 [Listeria aquatica FSL S10-1188]